MTTTSPKRRRRSPEKRIQRRIVRALQGLGWWVMDLSQPRRTMLPVGLPDLCAIHRRWGLVWIEVKAPKRGKRPEDLLTVAQRGWHATAADYDQRVITVDSVDDLMAKIGVRDEAGPEGWTTLPSGPGIA